MDKIIVQDSTKCKSGHYSGTIVRSDNRMQPSKDKLKTFEMKDYIVQINVSQTDKPELKLGFFKNLSVNSDLIQFIKRLGFETLVKTELDLDCVVNSKIEFDVINETKNGKTYSAIAINTVQKQ